MTSSLSVEDNIDTLVSAARDASENGASLLSTPEMSNFLAKSRRQALDRAMSEETDPSLSAMRAVAAEADIWVHLGSLCIQANSDKLFNRSYLIAPDGAIAARYDKLHMFDVTLSNDERYEESALYVPGDAAVVAKTSLGTFGLSVCYDLRFPEVYAQLALAGAGITFIPAAFTQPTGEAHWETLLKARAIETGCFVVAAGQAGEHESGRKTHGHSMVISPAGQPIAALERQNAVLYANLDLTEVERARARIPSLSHRRDFKLRVY